MTANCTSHSGAGRRSAPPSTSSCGCAPGTGSGTAIAGRATPLMRPMRSSAAAIVAPVLPALDHRVGRARRARASAAAHDRRVLLACAPRAAARRPSRRPRRRRPARRPRAACRPGAAARSRPRARRAGRDVELRRPRRARRRRSRSGPGRRPSRRARRPVSVMSRHRRRSRARRALTRPRSTWRPRYQPQLPHTMCGSFAAPQFGQSERGGRVETPVRRRAASASSSVASCAWGRPSVLLRASVSEQGFRARARTARPSGGRGLVVVRLGARRTVGARTSGHAGLARSAARAAARAAARRGPAARGRARARRAGRSRPRPGRARTARRRGRATSRVDVARGSALHCADQRAVSSPRTTMPSGTRSSTRLGRRPARRSVAAEPPRASSSPLRVTVPAGARVAEEVGDVDAEFGHGTRPASGLPRVRWMVTRSVRARRNTAADQVSASRDFPCGCWASRRRAAVLVEERRRLLDARRRASSASIAAEVGPGGGSRPLRHRAASCARAPPRTRRACWST